MSGTSLPRLVLHIGAGKTGSSAIQAMLAKNRDRLRARNIIIPDDKLALDGRVTATQVTFFRSLEPIGEEAVQRVERRLSRLAAHAARMPAASVVVSAENLFSRPEFASLFARAHESFDVVVLLYIRRQDDWLMSRWAQWGLKTNPDFRGWAQNQLGTAGDWEYVIETWRAALPNARFVPRIFARDVLVKGDVAADFLAATEIDSAGLDGVGNTTANERMNEVALRIVARNPGLFRHEHDNRFTDFLRTFGGALVAEPTPTGLMWTRDERQRVVALYADSNERVRARYFPDRPEGGLFGTYVPEDEQPLSEDEQLRRELALLRTVVSHRNGAGTEQLPRMSLSRELQALVVRIRRLARRTVSWFR
jgi:hypothetical protein